MEFFKTRKHRIKDLLEIEGVIVSPIIIAFSIFIINQFRETAIINTIKASSIVIFREIFFSLSIGIIIAWLVHSIIKHYPINKELTSLFIISSGIIVFITNELLSSNGSFSIIIYGLFLRGISEKGISEKYTSMLAHILFIIVFILFGIESFFPSPIFILKGFLLFITYLIIRFSMVVLFIDANLKEKIFFSLNIAKGIEIAIILFAMRLAFKESYALNVILSLGFLFFIFSYIVSTAVNHYSNKFLDYSKT